VSGRGPHDFNSTTKKGLVKMIELIIAVSFAIIVSAFCSLFEAVLYAVPTRHVETMIKAGRAGGKIFKKMRGNVDRPISAILSLNTIANTAGAAFAGSAASALFGHQWLVYFSAFFTLSILIFSEILPKTAGVVYGSRLVGFVAYPLKGLVWFMTPAIWLTSLVTRIIAPKTTKETVTAEEIMAMAELSLRRGDIKPYQERIIDGILTLQNKKARDVMTPRTVMFQLSEHLTVKEAIDSQEKWEHSRFPVYDQGTEDIVGIVLTRDVFIACAKQRMQTRLTDLMLPVHFVAEGAPLNRVLMEFLELKQHLFIVIDEYGGLSGLVTLEDIIEEILGREIVDESDEFEDKRELARMQRKRLIAKFSEKKL
jgi:CBS domain containing-hemolysin-like protein